MASDNRGHGSQEIQSTIQPTLNKTYANVITQNLLPKKDQAIIIESMDGITNDDYIDGLEKLIDASNIKFISKISGGRVCAFLSNKSLVEKLTNKTVQVKEYSLNIRPLMEKNKRVVISNVCPIIPHELLTDALKNKGISLVSQMNYIRAGLNKPGRSHILSFRRQVYIKEEDENLLPESLQINYDNTTYWVYLSTDSTCCFVCKQSGHIAKLCPKYMEETRTAVTPLQTNNKSIINKILDNHSTSPNVINPNKGIKRPPPASTSSEGSLSEQHSKKKEHTDPLLNEDSVPAPSSMNKDIEFKKPNTRKKKFKENIALDEVSAKETVNDLEKILLPVRPIIENPSDANVLNYNQFKMFLEKTRGRANSLEVALEFTKDIEGLIKMIEVVCHYLEDRSLKARCIRIKKKLLLQSTSDSEQDSDCSQQSDCPQD